MQLDRVGEPLLHEKPLDRSVHALGAHGAQTVEAGHLDAPDGRVVLADEHRELDAAEPLVKRVEVEFAVPLAVVGRAVRRVGVDGRAFRNLNEAIVAL